MVQQRRGGRDPAGLVALFIVVFAVDILGGLMHGTSIAASAVAFGLFEAAAMTAFLAWLIPKLDLRMGSIILLVWLELFAVEYVINYIEAVFFTNIFESSYFAPIFGSTFATALVSSSAVSLIVAGSSSFFLRQRGKVGGVQSSLRDYMATRTGRSWLLRIAVGSVAYFPIYFFFGVLVSPFVLPYYNNPSSGLTVPSFSVLIPVELFRGFLYVLVLLPLLAATADGATTRFAVLAATLYIPGALIPLVGNALMPVLPTAIIPFHALEILGDSIVYGWVLSRLVGRQR